MSTKKSVLVIDDNADAVEVLRRMLMDHDFEVLAAYSGEEGLKRLQEDAPDCVLLDVMMPGTSGFNVCKTIKHDMGLTVPVVILSAKSGPKEISYAKTVGADDYLGKPVSPRKLVEAIHAAISGAGRRAVSVSDMGSDKVLLVTGNVKTIHLLRQLFEDLVAGTSRRYKLVHAESQVLAERMTRSEPPALMIVDGHLPADGASMLCRSMKTDPKRRRIPIIALMPRSEDEIKYAWADSRLAEPIDTAVLVDCIKQHLAAAPRA